MLRYIYESTYAYYDTYTKQHTHAIIRNSFIHVSTCFALTPSFAAWPLRSIPGPFYTVKHGVFAMSTCFALTVHHMCFKHAMSTCF